MQIESVKPFSVHDLVVKLKQLTMLEDKSVRPYQNCSIQVTDIETAVLAPAQLYILRGEFEKVRDLRWAMLERCGVDILRMADWRVRNNELVEASMRIGDQLGYIEFTVDGQTVTILPPIVEVSEEADRTKVNIINDGMHRCYLARICRITPAVVRIEGIPKNLPYYAYPAPDGWSAVQMVEKIGPRLIKKYHRFPHGVYQKYYRDFNSSFNNVGGPRGHG